MYSIARRLVAVAALSTALAAPASAQSKDIVATAVGAGQFKTLAALLTEADLVKTLQGPGPFTVFAPTDEAFGKVPAATLTGLKADKKQLASVLTYHVVPGKVMAADLKKLADKDGNVTVKTVQGSDLKIHLAGTMVHVGADNANVVSADVAASNGVIHVIDKVVLPPAKKAM
jgi:uncharacterized surface protein with fasciclin (FAS1) repeats